RSWLAEFEFQAVAGGEPLPPVNAPGADRYNPAGLNDFSPGHVFLHNALKAFVGLAVVVLFPVVPLGNAEIVFPVRAEPLSGDHPIQGGPDRREVDFPPPTLGRHRPRHEFQLAWLEPVDAIAAAFRADL